MHPPGLTLITSDFVAAWKQNPELGAAILCEDTVDGKSLSTSPAHLPLEMEMNYSLPGATLCAKNFTSIISYHPQNSWEGLLLSLGHKRLYKLPKVRELLSGRVRIQN